MIRSLLKHLPSLEELKKQTKNNDDLILRYLNADIIYGEEQAVEYLLKLKRKYNNEKSN